MLEGVVGQHYAPAAPLYPPITTPRERDPVPTVQEAGLALGSVWTGAENRGQSGNDHVATTERLQRNCRHGVGEGGDENWLLRRGEVIW